MEINLTVTGKQTTNCGKYEVINEFSDLLQAKELYNRGAKRDVSKGHRIIRVLAFICCILAIAFLIPCYPAVAETNNISVIKDLFWGRMFLCSLFTLAALAGIDFAIDVPVKGSVLYNPANYEFAFDIMEKLNVTKSIDVEVRDGYVSLVFNLNDDTTFHINILDSYVTYTEGSSNISIKGYLEDDAYIIKVTLPKSVCKIVS